MEMIKLKRLLSVILTVVIYLTMVPGVSVRVSAASWPTTNNIKTYVISTENNTTVYRTSTSTEKYGTIYASDLITIKGYSGSRLKVTYPISGGTKTGYIEKSKVTSGKINKTIKEWKAKTNMTAYRRRSGNATIGSVSKGDKCYSIATANDRTQIIYPISNGWKMGWVKTSSIPAPNSDYNAKKVETTKEVNTHGIIFYADSKYSEVAASLFSVVLKNNRLSYGESNVYMRCEPNEKEYNRIISAVSKTAKEGDITYFYYIGHGDDKGSIFPDYTETKSGTYEKTPKQLINDLNKIPGTIVIILESCHSGCIQNVSNLDKEKFKIITSSRSNQFSDTDRIGISELRLGAFSEALLNGLGGLEGNNAIYASITGRDGKVKADYNGDRKVTVKEMFSYVEKNMDNIYVHKLVTYFQNPTCSNSNDNTVIYKY